MSWISEPFDVRLFHVDHDFECDSSCPMEKIGEIRKGILKEKKRCAAELYLLK